MNPDIQEYIDKLVSEYNLDKRHIPIMVDLHDNLNTLLENEILVRAGDCKFKEYYGFLRRGDINNDDQDISAEPFVRQGWPTVIFNRYSHEISGFIWGLLYEVEPEYLSSSFLNVGYQVGHDLAIPTPDDIRIRMEHVSNTPYFIGIDYSESIREGTLFSSISRLIDGLREKLETMEYQKRETIQHS
ncbi:hypothetical protein H6503_06400 [Candidatus Woesearchaeota archaeon]|nr:hypothetical protein [Candidatus Woesearchaeota archaeon]